MPDSGPVASHSGSTRALLGLTTITGLFCLIWIVSGVCQTPDPSPLNIKTHVNPNEASVAELLSLPGLGPTRAQAIVDYREQQQSLHQADIFTCPNDLTKIKGLGPTTVQRLEPYLRFSTTPK